jgi:hypothetical protein
MVVHDVAALFPAISDVRWFSAAGFALADNYLELTAPCITGCGGTGLLSCTKQFCTNGRLRYLIEF